MFESFLKPKNPELVEQRNSEKRQMAFNKEQNLLTNAINPNDDHNYMSTQDRKSDLIRWQQELEPEMYSLVLSFLSLRRKEDGSSEHIKDDKGIDIPPICNYLFIQHVVIPKLKPFLTKNLINSHLDKPEILQMQRLTADDITDMICDNFDKYGIDFVNFDGVLRDIKNVMLASVWRSYKGWTKKTDSSMIKRVETEAFGKAEEEKQKFKMF